MKTRLLLAVSLLLGLVNSTYAAINFDQWHGQWKQGGLIWGYLEPGTVLKVDGETIDQSSDGLFVFGFGRDAAAQVELALWRGDQALAVALVDVEPQEYRIQRVEGVPQRTVTPSEEHMARIRREAALVSNARASSIPEALFIEPFVWPTQGPITGVFGSQRVYNGVPGRPHYGVDVGVPKGTAVLAPAKGVVALAENDLFYSGGTIIIDHGMGVFSSLLHLSKPVPRVKKLAKWGLPVARPARI
jgi:murein DD-endopeptidase MepM/ murein hydrolase activator NlpD